MHLASDVVAPLTDRTVLTTSSGLALVDPLDGELEIVSRGCAMQYGEDPSDRPSPSILAEWWASLLDAETGELLGAMVWRALPYGMSIECTAWNIGIRLLPVARGRCVSSVAGLMLARYLLDTTEVDRIEANTEVANLPGWRGLEKAGFRREGITRGVTMRDGQRRDMFLYSLMRADLAGLTGVRAVLREDGPVALAEARPDDLGRVADPFAVDPDPQLSPASPPVPHRAAVLDARTHALLSVASWHPVDRGGTLACTAWMIDITPVPSPAEAGAAAVRVLTEHLFASTPLGRLEAMVEPDNEPARHALAAGGFQAEGVLRAARHRAGRARDLILYGRLR
ncbi:MAG TPA: GNAT family protein [Actinophytocola sp.]|uniref:GNAT family N-acetyltransferase n=1 Tax=Actinophytocola sp. TaxID=1872138 RepID=UPI002DBA375F|nr:GNAT family protein [Actinophytocola sp.]HEU5469466.1 GNAT family protein [Actinophytocola sp.]